MEEADLMLSSGPSWFLTGCHRSALRSSLSRSPIPRSFPPTHIHAPLTLSLMSASKTPSARNATPRTSANP